MQIDYLYLLLVGFQRPKQLVFPQQSKNLYKPAFLGVSTSIVTYCRAVQKRKALNFPRQNLEVKQPNIMSSKQSKEKVLADYAASHVLKA